MGPLLGFVGCEAHYCVPVSKSHRCRRSVGTNLSTKNLFAEVAHSVEHNLAKVGVASSSLVFRSKIKTNAGVAQLAECVPSKYEVAGSNPVTRSRALVIQP